MTSKEFGFIVSSIDIEFRLVDGNKPIDCNAAWDQVMLHTAEHVANQKPNCVKSITKSVVKFDPLTFTLISRSKIMQMKPSEVNLCCLIDHRTRWVLLHYASARPIEAIHKLYMNT